jgi:hypothetical protein
MMGKLEESLGQAENCKFTGVGARRWIYCACLTMDAAFMARASTVRVL